MTFATRSASEKRATAELYARRVGMAAFPVIGKVPVSSASWLPTHPGVSGRDADWQRATGYALAPMQATQAILDVDDPALIPALLKLLPALATTFGTVRGTHTHYYLSFQRLLPAPIIKMPGAGNSERASLRSYGGYVVGPASDHQSGDQYQWNGKKQLVQLDHQQAEALLAFLQPPIVAVAAKPNVEAIYQWARPGAHESVLSTVIRLLEGRGYRYNKAWLNGRCIHPENHTNNDDHGSFGMNTETGIGHCFACGNFRLSEIAAALGVPRMSIDVRPESAPYAFASAANVSNVAQLPDDQVGIEPNIASALIRRGKYRALRLYELLTDAARRADGQHTYSMIDISELGKQHGLTRTQCVKAIGQLVTLGFISRSARGVYRRTSVERVKELLNLGGEHALIAMPRAVYASLSAYKQALLIAIQKVIPAGQSARTIASAAGMSRRSLYNHEQQAGVERTTNARRVNTATAAAHFIKVFDSENRFVRTVNGTDAAGAMELAINNSGKPWGWNQQPSTRFLPSIN